MNTSAFAKEYFEEYEYFVFDLNPVVIVAEKNPESALASFPTLAIELLKFVSVINCFKKDIASSPAKTLWSIIPIKGLSYLSGLSFTNFATSRILNFVDFSPKYSSVMSYP